MSTRCSSSSSGRWSVRSVARPTGWVSDKYGGGRVTFWTFLVMIAAVGRRAVLPSGIKDQPGAFWGFFACFMALFFATGVGNASTFQMIPIIMRQEVKRLMPQA